MNYWINKDTEIYCSFAKTAGNTGCQLMNSAFYYYGMNKIYKSFSIDNIEEGILAVKILNIKGFAVTMPFKKEVLKYVDIITKEALESGSANTVKNYGGKLEAYNTDVYSTEIILKEEYQNNNLRMLYILGNGGFASAVKYSARKWFSYKNITRENWNEVENIRDSIIFNCTPVENIKVHNSNKYIDCIVGTETGNRLAKLQASKQFELYTQRPFPL
jgi:shikimate dehydrogenase